MTSLRILVLGGLTSYRALFGWLSPWILIPTFLLGPIFQIMFFAYVGRAAGVGNDSFFLIGNAVQYASIPCLFAMGNTIDGERNSHTLGLLLVSPARRIPLFVGRALPVIVNGFVVTVFSLVVGALVLGVSLPARTLPALVLISAVAAFACTGLGLVTAAIALRVRETATMSNVVFGILLIFCGVNVPLAALPGWMASVGNALPLTHAIDAARDVAAGAALADVGSALAAEAALGTAYLVLGLVMLRVLEIQSRQHATLELG